MKLIAYAYCPNLQHGYLLEYVKSTFLPGKLYSGTFLRIFQTDLTIMDYILAFKKEKCVSVFKTSNYSILFNSVET